MDKVFDMTVTNRKIRKPLMERKRRARINHSLDELQQILSETDFTSKGTKMEKADILEMTVQLLKNLKQNDSTKEMKENLENLMTERYLLGFEKCVREIGRIPGMDTVLVDKITTHLSSCLEEIKKISNPCAVPTAETDRLNDYPVPWKATENCSILLQGGKEFKILPSKLPNGDVVLFISSSLEKFDDHLNKSDMWRPWW